MIARKILRQNIIFLYFFAGFLKEFRNDQARLFSVYRFKNYRKLHVLTVRSK